ncbi:Rv0361 family membrane protein [Mycobacterium angelicum]|uniref:Rv0361 family membrane protein n=1 Tax=Mycobacterium angelicum TaxID=470074 RepID=UPI0009F698FF|nr:hypothetical protein [Mycobacterium angelicum]MCV7199029.1 nuclear transport factor 2 family protein [Mycobacterium angelicum]
MTGGSPVAQHVSAPAPAPAPGTRSAPTGSVAVPLPPPPVTAEDQIRETLTVFQDAYNTQNWDAYLELMCSAMRAKFTGTTLDYVKKNRAATGITRIESVTAISITGDTATVVFQGRNEAIGNRSITVRLKLEDGWKICQV